ncbi:MAG: aldehyde ferredoxin oxidoreductase N-terminal domain-containing protein [Pseudomonadota bacterium]
MDIAKIHAAHEVLAEFCFDPVKLSQGYAGRTLRIDVGAKEFRIDPVDQQMKDLWTGGKGFDVWLMSKEIDRDTTWDAPNNPICFSSGPLGGSTSVTGAGKTIVTSVSPLTSSIMDCNVGGYFGPYLKFTGFDALTVIGKAEDEVIVFIDGDNNRITIERAPMESVDSHVLAEQLTEMYAESEDDKRNVAVVSAGRGAKHTRMGVLNFSFYDWRRKVPRLKQAGRGGVGTVFRNKKIKALVIKRRDINPAWVVTRSKAAGLVETRSVQSLCSADERAEVKNLCAAWGADPEWAIEILQDIQARFLRVSHDALDEVCRTTGAPKAWLYRIATFYHSFSLTPRGEQRIQVCTGSACAAKGAGKLIDEFSAALGVAEGGTTEDGKYTLEGVSCLGVCAAAPVVKVGDRLFGSVTARTVKKILSGDAVPLDGGAEGTCCCGGGEELRVALRARDKGAVVGTYAGAKATMDATPAALIGTLKASGLRGRGGMGFPAGDKWAACTAAVAATQTAPIIACNANGVGPVMEADPHAVLDGMLAAALTLGATEGLIYMGPGNPSAAAGLAEAIEEARAGGWLGADVRGTGKAFDVRVHRGAGGFVAGEASAVLAAMGGRVGEPRDGHVHATEHGLRGAPTLLHNVETWANVSAIAEKGADWFRSLGGTAASPGAKVVSVSGAVTCGGTFEVPMGTSLVDLVERYAGGMAAGQTLKALQVGGASGGFVPASGAGTALDYEALAEAGTLMGNGVVVALGQGSCVADSLRSMITFLADQSCGQCTPCREGLFAAKAALDRLCGGTADGGDLGLLEEIGGVLADTSMCGFGRTAALPIRSALAGFREEIEAHTGAAPRCPAAVCKAMITYTINDNCNGCTLCARKCPETAITGEKKEPHVIDQALCTHCGTCRDVCKFDAVEVH